MYERTMRHIAPPVKEERHERFSSSSRSAEVKARRSPLALEPIEFGSILCPPSPDEQMYRMHLIEKMFEDSEDEVTELDLEDTEAFEGFSSIHLSFVGDARDAGLV